MSKLYKRYLQLKQDNDSKIYLFKSGIFYIFLQDDATKMSNLLNLKLTNLNELSIKEAYDLLETLTQKARQITKEMKKF